MVTAHVLGLVPQSLTPTTGQLFHVNWDDVVSHFCWWQASLALFVLLSISVLKIADFFNASSPFAH